MTYFLEHLSAMSRERKIERMRSYLAYLQTQSADPAFLDLLLMARELHESSICQGDTSIIDAAAAINEVVFKTLVEDRDYIDRPYYMQGYDSDATVGHFETKKNKDYTKLPVVSAISIFTALQESTQEHDNDNIAATFGNGFLSADKGTVMPHVVYRIVKSKFQSNGLCTFTLLNESTGMQTKIILPQQGANTILGY